MLLFALSLDIAHPIFNMAAALFHNIRNRSYIIEIRFCEKGDRTSFFAGPPGSSHSMDIRDPRGWKIIVDYHVNGAEINPSCYEVRAYEDPCLTTPKFDNRLFSRSSGASCVNYVHVNVVIKSE